MGDLIPLLNAKLPIEICKRICQLRREHFRRERVDTFEQLYAPIHYIKHILVPDNRRSSRVFYTIHWNEQSAMRASILVANIRYCSPTGHDIISDHLLFMRAILNNDPRAIDRNELGSTAQMRRPQSGLIYYTAHSFGR